MTYCTRLALSLCAASITTFSFCQKNFVSASVTTLQGDTVSGFIDYRNWGKNPASIHFKRNLQQESIVYNPTQIAGFRVADERYQSAIVTLDKSPYKLENLSDSSGYDFGTDTTFLLTIADGTRSLYYYKDKAGKENFFIRKGRDFEYLLFKNYLRKDDDGKMLIGINENYLQQLSEYLVDCPSVSTILLRTGYNQKDFTRVFRSYYDCTRGTVTYQKKGDKNLSEFGITGGLVLTKLAFKGETFPFLTGIAYPWSKTPSFGIFYNLVMPRNLGKFSLYNELLYTSYKVSGRYNESQSENKSTVVTTSLGYTYLKLNNMVRYTIPLKQVSMHLNVGISNGLAISVVNEMKRETTFYTSISTENGQAIDAPRKHELGIVGGVGIKVKKYSLDARFESGNGMSDYLFLGSSTKRAYFLLGYRL